MNTCSSDDKSWIELEPVRPESWVLEKFDELFDVALQIHIRQVWHHMCHNLRYNTLK